MRRIFCSLAFVALLASPAAAYTSDVAVYGSYTKPQAADNSFGGGVKLRFGYFEMRSTYFRGVTAHQSNFSCPPFCANGKPRIQYVPLEAGLVYKFEQDPTIQPYLGAGGGYYFLRQPNSDFFRLKDEVGFYGVVGTDINFSRNFGLMIEGNYRRVRATAHSTSSDLPAFSAGAKLQVGGPGVNAGFVWHF